MLNQITQSGTAALAEQLDDDYPALIAFVQSRIDQALASGARLFTTDADNLFDIYLAGIAPELRQHYTCNACKSFLNRYGGLVTIDENGETKSVFWEGAAYAPEKWVAVCESLWVLSSTSKVTGVFVSGERTLGQPVTGEWHHLAATLAAPVVWKNALTTANQRMAQLREEHRMLALALAEFDSSVVTQALALLRSETLYRSDRVLGVGEWFFKLQERLAATKNATRKSNLLWLATATAPAGFCHVKSSMIGTLLDDIKAGLPIATIKARFSEKMNPANYQRAQAAPDAGNIQRAEEIVEKLGLRPSLERRFATVAEVEKIWQPSAKEQPQPSAGVFAKVAPKAKKAVPSAIVPAVTMTWAKFLATVLPTARAIQAQIPADSARFAALVAPVHPEAPAILAWDNQVSWYYHGGADAEMKRRVLKAGGRYDEVDLRCTLMWNTYTDLDIHCQAATRTGNVHIYYGNKNPARQHGWLDVDMNISASTLEPVENIRWPKGQVEDGAYEFYVHDYTNRSTRNEFDVELYAFGQTYRFYGVLAVQGQTHRLCTVNVVNGTATLHTPNGSVVAPGTGTATGPTVWGLPTGAFVDVEGVALSPNLWGKSPSPHHGSHVFFLLKGCHDESEGRGRGFFNEMLKGELREVRQTLEAFTAATPLQASDGPLACGLGMTNNAPWNLTLRVTGELGASDYTIDRWD